MATSNTAITDSEEDTSSQFMSHMTALRASIQQHYSALIDAIRQRESQLLQELAAIEHKYRQEYKKNQKSIDDLQESRKHTLNSISGEDMMDFRDSMVKLIDDKIKLVKIKIDTQTVNFEWDTQLAYRASEIGSLKCQSSSQPTTLSIDYKKKVDPAIKTCQQGTATGELNQAWGVATDSNTNNIYVVDFASSRVCVFSSKGEFLFQFNGNTNNTIKMSNPFGIAIHENKVFVSQHSTHCIQVYTLDGTYIDQFGGKGVGKDQLICPQGVAISGINGDIFICEYGNNRVQIFSRDYKHKSFLGVNQLQAPRDVKLAQQEIFVLENNTPCVHIYDYNSTLLRSVINSSGNGYTINNVHCMFVDRDNNIILSDYGTHCVLVFSYTGDIIHQIGNTAKMFTNPFGVLIDSLGRLIIVSQQKDACIQIF